MFMKGFNMVILYNDKKDCCGCGACMNICPVQAIKMIEDEDGFIYPSINREKCIECFLCKKHCGYQNFSSQNMPLETFVAQSTNSSLQLSASGGVFSSISTNFLQNDGIVYGVSLEYKNNMLEPEHICINNLDDLIKLQGSKYIQSKINYSYKNIKKSLKEGKKVLFSGTPCQIEGLKAFLGKPFPNLYCIDLICHGVPNAKFFQSYISYLESKISDKIIDFKFRDKDSGWGLTGKGYTAKGYTTKGRFFHIPCYESSYYEFFLQSFICRLNCYTCKHSNCHRVGDITIGDFWGVEREYPHLFIENGGVINSQKGVSCIIVNNEKGKELLSIYGKSLFLFQSDYQVAAKYNAQLSRNCKYNPDMRQKILNAYKDNGYAGVEALFSKFRMKMKVKNSLKNILKCILPKYAIEKLKELRNK